MRSQSEAGQETVSAAGASPHSREVALPADVRGVVLGWLLGQRPPCRATPGELLLPPPPGVERKQQAEQAEQAQSASEYLQAWAATPVAEALLRLLQRRPGLARPGWCLGWAGTHRLRAFHAHTPMGAFHTLPPDGAMVPQLCHFSRNSVTHEVSF